MAKRRTKKQAQQDQNAAFALCIIAAVTVIVVIAWLVQEAELHPVAGSLGLLAAVAFGGLGGVKWWQRRQDRAQVSLARSREIGRYHQMNPKEFEHALAYLCRRDGCTGVTVVGGAGDLAADVLATTPDGRRIMIQAKRYAPTNPVRSPALQAVNGTYRQVHGTHLAAVVTTSRFTPQAAAFGRQVGLRLVDAQALAGWASQTGPAPWH